MENEIYKFYESKSKLFFLLLGIILLFLGGYWMSKSAVFEERFYGHIGLIVSGLFLILAILKIISNKAFIEVSSTYIKMYNFEKLLWTDITNVREVQFYGAKVLFFYVEDISKYKLTFWQKVNKTSRLSPPFYISLDMLSKEDLEKLQQLIRQYADYQ